MPLEFAFMTHATLEAWEKEHGRRLDQGRLNYWRMRPEYSQLPQSELDKWEDREARESAEWARNGG